MRIIRFLDDGNQERFGHDFRDGTAALLTGMPQAKLRNAGRRLRVAKLLAPAMPFLADELYQNLVRGVDAAAPESVHLAKWPETYSARIDEALNRDMGTVVKLVSLGHAARQKANRKVRQPLAVGAFSLGNATERKAVETFAELISDELNVKKIRLLDSATEAVAHTVKPLPKQLGQKYGNKFPAIQKAILAMDAEAAAHSLLNGDPLKVQAGGETFDILPDEVEVRAQARSGFAVAEEGAYVAALVIELTPELVREGQAREFVRRVQDLRKSAELDVSDRIKLYVTASDGLKAAIEAHREYITAETLTTDLQFAAAPAEAQTAEDNFDGETLTVGLVKA